jgi:translation initiation factor 4E transporter
MRSSRGIWDPDRSHSKKRSETPPDDEVRPRDRVELANDLTAENQAAKRRSGDPRERIRKEQDGIVLSPQRRSFHSGCFVNVSTETLNKRPVSPIGKNEVSILIITSTEHANNRLSSSSLHQRCSYARNIAYLCFAWCRRA